jgi:hypothetical protein
MLLLIKVEFKLFTILYENTIMSTYMLELMLAVPGDVWTLILMKVTHRQCLLLTMSVNKTLRQFLANKVKWRHFITRYYGFFEQVEKSCRDYYYRKHPNWPEYNRALRAKTDFAKFYYLTREAYINKHVMPADGTCDFPEQLARKFPMYSGKMYMSKVERCTQPKNRGWRWHKWGEYHGKLRINTGYSFKPEYLYDANGKHGNPVIDEAWVFSRHDKSRGKKVYFEKGTVVS